jgi:hypothetical protein
MNCRNVEPLISRHLEGRLPAREAGAVSAHLDRCLSCRRRRDEFLAIGAELRALATLPAPVNVERHAVARWDAERGAPGAGLRRPWGMAAMATILLAVLGLGIAVWEQRSAPPNTRVAVREEEPGSSPTMMNLSRSIGHRPLGTRRMTKVRTLSDSSKALLTRRLESRAEKAQSPPARAKGSVREGGLRAVPARGFNRRGAAGLRLVGGPSSSTAGSLPEGISHLRQPTDVPAAVEALGQIESRVRRTVPVRDDFVQVPFPRLVSTSERQIAQAAESYKREAAVVDARLVREVTLQQKATALSDLCERLRSETGIQLVAGASVADEKVTLFCRKLPLRDVMRQLSRPFGYAWLRSRLPAPTSRLPAKAGPASAGSQKPGAGSRGEAAYRYELVQDLRSQLLEEELRSRDRNAALLALDSEMNRYRQYLALSPDEALARARTAPPAEKTLLEHFAGSGWGVAQLYFRLTPRDLAALRAGQRVAFSAEPQPGEQSLPPDLARGVLQSLRDTRVVWRDGQAQVRAAGAAPEGLPPASVPEARATVSLWMAQTEVGQFKLDGDSGVRFDPRRNGYAEGSPLAVAVSPAARNPQNAAANARMAHDPTLRARVTVRPEPSCGPVGHPSPSLPLGAPPSWRHAGGGGRPADTPALPGIREQLPLPASGRGQGGEVNPAQVTTADVLEALHRAAGLPIVADYYTRLYEPDEVSARDQPLYEALNQLADAMRLRWKKEGGWLQFRSASYFNDRLKEVPNRLLARWAASRKEHGALTLDDLIEIAQLSDAQLDGAEMAEGARFCTGLAEWDLARNRAARPHLRFLAGLTPAQRQAVASATGLPYTGMSLAQQQQFLSLALGSRADRLPSLRALDRAAMRVDYLLPGAFEWKAPVKPDGPFWSTLVPSPVRERSPAAALQAARRIDPQAEPSQIVPTELALTIMYPLGGPETGFRNPFVLRTDKDGNHSVLARPIEP